jgi:hypothetical protein
MNLALFTPDKIVEVFKKKNYILFEDPYRLNLFGIRNKETQSNTFNDLIGMVYKDYGGSWNTHLYMATTDPGKYWLQNPMNVNGTAIVVPGQYIDVFTFGTHKSTYKCLVQCAKIKVYRDNDKDDILDFDPITVQSGIFAIQMHRASDSHTSIQVDKWSAGCQVIASPIDFADLMEMTENWHAPMYGNKFNYTLFKEEDFV